MTFTPATRGPFNPGRGRSTPPAAPADPTAVPRLCREWVGHTVRTRRELRNGNHTIPVGSVATIEGTYRGTFSLRTTGCARCGVRVHITHVPKTALELVAPDTLDVSMHALADQVAQAYYELGAASRSLPWSKLPSAERDRLVAQALGVLTGTWGARGG